MLRTLLTRAVQAQVAESEWFKTTDENAAQPTFNYYAAVFALGKQVLHDARWPSTDSANDTLRRPDAAFTDVCKFAQSIVFDNEGKPYQTVRYVGTPEPVFDIGACLVAAAAPKAKKQPRKRKPGRKVH